MSPTAQTILSFFTLLLLSVATYLVAKRIKVPYTVLLVLTGVLLVPLGNTETFAYLHDFKLTPDMLFFIFLPTLIFESAYNMNIRDIGENLLTIGSLAIVSLLVSAFFIAFVSHWVLSAVGFPVPFVVLLLFGALISATDPVAVLALFKEFGAPKRLSLIFEGESLFNDGTALALFLVVLEGALKGFHGTESYLGGAFTFVTMIIGGTLFGFFMGGLFSQLLKYARHEHLQLTITLAAAHLTFLLSELISHHLEVFGHHIYLSSIIATVITSIVLGAESRYKISPAIQEYMERFWSYAAFVANSLVFILLGLMFSNLDVNRTELLMPLAIIIAVVIIGRIIAVYPVLGALNLLGKGQPIPRSWQTLIAWGSFRGALAVMMVMLIPEDYVPDGWQLEPSARSFIMALTIGCIYFTLFFKATTMNKVMRGFHITDMQDVETLAYREGKVSLYARSLLRLLALEEKPYVDLPSLKAAQAKYAGLYQGAYEELARQTHDSKALFSRVLRVHAIGIETQVLKDLFENDEISEPAFRRAVRKLERQSRSAERGLPLEAAEADGPGWWRRLGRHIGLKERNCCAGDRYLYYRALSIAAHEVIESLSQMAAHEALSLFESDEVFSGVIELYQRYERRAAELARNMMSEDPSLANQQLAFIEHEVANAQAQSLIELESSGMITPKIHTILAKENAL